MADDFKKKVGIACESNNTPKESFNYEKDDIHFLSIIEQDKNGPVNVINRMSPEVFLHNVLKELIVADIKGEIKDFLKYKVHYVGKATEQNICKRLTGYSTLQDILSLEKPMSYGNIPADEIVLLLFEVEDNYSFSQSDMTDLSGKDIANFINNYELPSSKILSLDAEKALVKAMSPNYNKIRFKSYPNDNDLINIDNHQCIAYRLFDPITLIYQDGKMRGDNLSRFCDFIFVEKK